MANHAKESAQHDSQKGRYLFATYWLATTLKVQRKYSESEALYKESIEMRKSMFGESDEEVDLPYPS